MSKNYCTSKIQYTKCDLRNSDDQTDCEFFEPSDTDEKLCEHCNGMDCMNYDAVRDSLERNVILKEGDFKIEVFLPHPQPPKNRISIDGNQDIIEEDNE